MQETRTSRKDLIMAFALCTKAYLMALCIAVGVGHATGERHPLLIAFVADVAATLTIYLFARVFRNASFYDAYWSLAPIAIAVYFLLGTASVDANLWRQVAVIALVSIWGIRLTYNWARQWRGLGHEDWRYAGFRHRTGKRFWFVELAGIEMMPTLIVFLGCMSLYPALTSTKEPFCCLDWLAVVVTGGAILIEATADEQLRSFVRSNPGPGAVMDRGLWRYSRHPNYLGEVMFWWGLFLFALAADLSYWWCVAGPVAMTLLFVFISIPMMDKRNLERRPGYAEHMKKVPALIPWSPKK